MVSFTTWLPYPKEKRPCYQLNRAWYLSQHSYSLRAKRSENRIPVGRDFPPVQTDPAAHPASCKMGTESFPGVKYGRGVMLTTHSLLVPWSRKGRAIHLPTLWATTGPVMGTLYLSIYIYFNMWNIWVIYYVIQTACTSYPNETFLNHILLSFTT